MSGERAARAGSVPAVVVVASAATHCGPGTPSSAGPRALTSPLHAPPLSRRRVPVGSEAAVGRGVCAVHGVHGAQPRAAQDHGTRVGSCTGATAHLLGAASPARRPARLTPARLPQRARPRPPPFSCAVFIAACMVEAFSGTMVGRASRDTRTPWKRAWRGMHRLWSRGPLPPALRAASTAAAGSGWNAVGHPTVARQPKPNPQAGLYVGRGLNGTAEGLLMCVYVGAVEIAPK